MATDAPAERISLVVPVYNEALNLPTFYERTHAVFQRMGRDYEILVVDDGSQDASFEVLANLAKRDPRLKVLHFRYNFGQTAALSAGIHAATGDLVVLIDSDLENDPDDIERVVAKLLDGFDVVSGWRKNRWKGQLLTRKLPSLFANQLISLIAGVPLHDYGCTLKGYRRDVIKNIALYGEMHRFIPAYAHRLGARITEIEVRYSPRVHGHSNYGLSRLVRVLPDLLLLNFMQKYMNRPIHFFGLLGFWAFGAGIVALGIAGYLRFVTGLSLIRTPLPLLSAMFVIVGVQLFVIGLVAEILMRTYYESQGKRPYMISKTLNLD